MKPARTLAIASTLALSAVAVSLGPPQAHTARAAGGSWPTYHLDNARSGYDAGEGTFTSQNTAANWSQTGLDGSVYGSPLVFNGLVFVGTENDTVYAFNESTGAVAWSNHLASPVASSRLGCGNIGTVGITSTMVIDTSLSLIYAVGLVSTSSTTMQDEIWVLHTGDGTSAAGWSGESLDLGGAINPRYQGQRAALTFANGYVYVAWGGRDGDCGTYHPQVVAVNGGSGALISFQPQTGGQNRAGIWAASGAAVDGSGNVWVTTGNGAETNCANAWDYGNGVLKLNATLTLQSYWRPGNWCSLSGSDQDIGSIGPSLIGNGEIFQAGKPGDGYLISQAGPGGQNGQIFSSHVDGCPTSDAIFGGNAYDGTRVFVPCTNGLIALSLNATSFGTVWTSSSQGGISYFAEPPIVAGGYVWSQDRSSSNLYGFNEATGARTFTISVGGHQHFATPAAADGYLFVPVSSGVVALKFNATGVLPRASLYAANGSSTWAMTSGGAGFNPPTLWSGTNFAGSVTTLLADVTGDGKPDLIAVNNGSTYVMTSNGNGFNPPQLWSGNTPFYGNVTTLAADIDGDGKADLIAVNNNGAWVMTSTGSGFNPPARWSSTPFYGNIGTYAADVSGDHKADLVAVNTGSAWVETSTGTAFAAPALWSSAAFYGNVTTVVGDVTGNGNSAVVAVNTGGSWVMASTGAGFAAPADWSSSPFYGSWATLVCDVSGNGKADLVAVDYNTITGDGNTWVMTSAGSSFGPPAEWSTSPFRGSVGTFCG